MSGIQTLKTGLSYYFVPYIQTAEKYPRGTVLQARGPPWLCKAFGKFYHSRAELFLIIKSWKYKHRISIWHPWPLNLIGYFFCRLCCREEGRPDKTPAGLHRPILHLYCGMTSVRMDSLWNLHSHDCYIFEWGKMRKDRTSLSEVCSPCQTLRKVYAHKNENDGKQEGWIEQSEA